MKKQLKYSINMEITLGHLFKKLFNKACFRKKKCLKRNYYKNINDRYIR